MNTPCIQTFWTEFGSAYEVDLANKRMRRTSGEHDPTRNQGKDGDWRDYEEISQIAIGLEVTVVWGWGGEAIRRTRTSRVVNVWYP